MALAEEERDSAYRTHIASAIEEDRNAAEEDRVSLIGLKEEKERRD